MRRKETRPRLKFSRELLEPIIQVSTNFCDVARRLGYPEYTVRGSSGKLAKKVKLFGISCNHFSYPLKGAAVRKSDGQTFCSDSVFHNRVHKKRLVEIRGNTCENCGISEWLGKSLVLDVHHKNKNRRDNRPTNLLVVCPNCHRFLHQEG